MTQYVIVTPVRDEEKHLEATIASVMRSDHTARGMDDCQRRLHRPNGRDHRSGCGAVALDPRCASVRTGATVSQVAVSWKRSMTVTTPYDATTGNSS